MNPHILALDPILSDADSYGQTRNDYRATNAAYFAGVLKLAAETNEEAATFCDLLQKVLNDLSAPGTGYADPYFSSVFMSWINGLNRGLDWITAGAGGECLQFFCDTDAFLKDLSLEYPSYQPAAHHYATIDDTIYIIPAQFMMHSPRMGQRLVECIPEIQDPELFTSVGEAELQKIKEHIEAALRLIYELSEHAYKLLQQNVHTIYVGLYEFRKNSFGTRVDYPGSIIAGISRERLEQNDTIATAVELYHEHCHLKLSLFCYAKKMDLPKTFDLISPFKNENRDFETALHTVYTLSIECHLRLKLLDKIHDPAGRERAIAFLAAVGYRLEIFRESLAAHECMNAADAFQKVLPMSAQVLREAFAVVEASPLAHVHLQEKQHIRERHIWDTGQFLSRGIAVRDPHLSDVQTTGHITTYTYNGQTYQATRRQRRVTRGDYGAHIEKALKQRKAKSTTPA